MREATVQAQIEPSPDHVEEDRAEQRDNVVPSYSYATQPMVGIGGSAGSITALQAFFQAMPPDTGMAFVVVLHLAADRESALAEILQRCTAMPVQQVTESAAVAANYVYVIPPGKALHSADGHLHCLDLTPDRGRRVAVDLFFRTLADSHGARAAAVILSGADGDGAIGLKRIKERGGLTIAQDPDEAEFDSMPRTAIGTGMVDWVLPVRDMPARLRSYHDILPRLRLPPEDGVDLGQPVPPGGADLEPVLRELLAFVRGQTGRDFVNYKRATVLRRVARRMGVNGIDDLTSYLSFMRTHPGEAGALLKDLLISVTNFFRDRHTIEALAGQVPALFAGKGREDLVRVWVVGCATGEEAYSIGMLLSEHAASLDEPPAIQIFATDLDEDAIRIGRDGVYPLAITADVSDSRLRRFFSKEARGYRVRTELRERVLFAVHDVLHDSPFSRCDLVSCRNLLIYLNRGAQTRALETAHFALRPEGRLFLGSSETITGNESLFAVVDAKHRIYSARLLAHKSLPATIGQSTLARAMELQDRNREMPGTVASAVGFRGQLPTWLRASLADAGVRSWRELHLKLIERFAPPSLIVTDAHEIVHLSEQAGRFLHFSAGEPTSNLLSAVHPALSIDLRSVLARARDSSEPVASAPVPFVDGDDRTEVVIHVARADDIASGFLLVTFESRPADPNVAPVRPSDPVDEAAAARMARQIDELKWHLRDVSERSESTTQELKANNEELQAINEELRSATEELETGREELQSINEELTTVNVELKNSVDGLGRSNADLQNLIGSTSIATVFLDRDLRVTLYTPSATSLFNLIASDVGRPLADLASRLDYPQLGDDARQVLAELVPVEREVSLEGKVFVARVSPYRSGEDRIAGVVLTFLDITERKGAEELLRESEIVFRTIVSQAAAGVAHLDLEGRLTLVNPRFCEITGYAEPALLGRLVFELVHPEDRAANEAAFRRLASDGTPFEMEKRYVRADGGTVWVSAAVTATPDVAGRPSAAIAVLLDISERRASEQALRASEERLRLLLENAREYAIFSTTLDRRVTSWNKGAERLTGYSEEEMIGKSSDLIFTEDDRGAGSPEREADIAIREGRAADERWHVRKDGSRFWGSGAAMSIRGEDGQAVGMLKIFRDQSVVRAAQQALEKSRAELVEALVDNRRARAEAEAASHAKDRFLAILSHELRTPMTPVVMALHALERSVDLPPAARGTLDLIRRNVKAELHLIDDLLDVTRISTGKLEITRQRIDMHQVIRTAADVCDGDLVAKRQRLRMTLGAIRHEVMGDDQRLQQAVWNLLKNASKFAPVEGEIAIETRNAGSQFCLTVSDNGVGIEPEALKTIFDAFAQEGPWVTTEFGGLGLGLAIATATIEAHHGTLKAQSEGRNQGATFTVELPTEPNE